MRSSSIILLFVVVGLGNARRISSDVSHELRRILKEYERYIVSQRDTVQSDDHTKTSYQLVQDNDRSDSAEHFINWSNQLVQQGANGYAYSRNVFDASNNFGDLFASIDGSSSTYVYKFKPVPDSSSEFLAQVNEVGANGYRLKTFKNNGTVNMAIYIKDLGEPQASYTYQELENPFDIDQIHQQIAAEGADGYLFHSVGLDPISQFLYFKDTSQSSTFSVRQPPGAGSSDDFLTQANDLGASGYRYTGTITPLYFPTNDHPYSDATGNIPLYYKDSNHPDLKYSYVVKKRPSTLSDYLTQLNQQGQKGFRLIGFTHFYDEHVVVSIYLDLNKCKCSTIYTNQYL